ncbi:MAG TPA: peptidylprolyl isomerase, partial [Gemmatimonadaceae bacterium]|nr:peptidylprolyl isomerase [Gemmatimonadaceae bacterium]
VVVGVLCAGGARPAPAAAQRYSAADSALVARILLAEDRRDTASAPYADGMRNPDARIRVIARRAIARARDARFTTRDSILPKLPDPPKYDDPAWRYRYRQLGNRNDNCRQLGEALHDSVWAVRLRAADLVTSACARDSAVANVVRAWVAGLPGTTAHRAGDVSWHAAAHGFVALARIAPAEARTAMPRLATSAIPQVRTYAARAAAVLDDTATLVRLAGDHDDNVKEAAITGLASVAGHAQDQAIIAALGAPGYQAVRAAARALRASPLRDIVLSAAITNALRLRGDSSESSRDARRAVVDLIASFATPPDWPRIAPLAADFDCTIAAAVAALGDSLGDAGVKPKCTPFAVDLPPDAVRLALGADVRVRVTMADSSGGGSFVVRLRGDIAPVMGARVLQLVRAGYYDNRPWHRVEHDFVIQGPGANEYVGSPRYVRDELGNVPHARGTVGMSTRAHDTGDAQWFVNLKDNIRLGRDYSVFAEVTDGIDVVDAVLEGDVVARMEVVGDGR